MAKRMIYISDLSQTPIEDDGQLATVLVSFKENGRKKGFKLEVTREEALELGSHGRPFGFSTGRKRTPKTEQESALGSLVG